MRRVNVMNAKCYAWERLHLRRLTLWALRVMRGKVMRA